MSGEKKLTKKDYLDLEAKHAKLEAEHKAMVEEGKAREKGGMDAIISGGKAPEVHTAGRGGNSLELKAMASFGALGNVKKLATVNVAEAQFAHVDAESKALVLDLKHTIQTARFVSQYFYDGSLDSFSKAEKIANCKNILESNYAKEILIPKLKAFGTGVAGGGAEWIPTIVASSFIPEFELERALVSFFRDVPMPSNPYKLPTATDLTIARGIAENTTATDNSFSTGDITFDAQKFVEYYIVPEELDEDSAPNFVAFSRQELTQAHLRAYETAAINGDSDGTHIDADTQAGAADLAEKQLNGLRKAAIDNSANGSTVDFGNAVVNDANLRLMRQRMKKLGVNPLDCLWIPGSTTYNQMMGTDNVVTVEKYGPQATVVKGSMANYAGIPIVVSGFMREDLNATGVQDGVTVDRTGLLLIHRKRWYWGTRRPIKMALRPSRSADDRFEMASYSRVDFQGHPQSASEVGAVYGLNVSV